MNLRMTPTRKTPTTRNGKIIFTKRQVSHSHCCTSRASKRRVSGISSRQKSATAAVAGQESDQVVHRGVIGRITDETAFPLPANQARRAQMG